MNTIINKISKLINETPTGSNRNILTDVNIILHQQINLCDNCQFHIATCSGIGIDFGNGKSDDNIIQCDTYKFEL